MQVERWAYKTYAKQTFDCGGRGKTSSKSSKSNQIPTYVTEESVYALIREIGKKLTDEKIYSSKQVADVFTMKPSKSFLEDVNALLHRFRRRQDRDKFMKEFYAKMYGNWKEYFNPCNDHKVVFLMVVDLTERLLTAVKNVDSQASCDMKVCENRFTRNK